LITLYLEKGTIWILSLLFYFYICMSIQDFLSPFPFVALRNSELDAGTERSAYLTGEASWHTILAFLSLSYHQLFHSDQIPVYTVTTVYWNFE
jgi:hypothetical protein